MTDIIHLYYRDEAKKEKVLQIMEDNRCELSFYKNKLKLKGGKRRKIRSNKKSRILSRKKKQQDASKIHVG